MCREREVAKPSHINYNGENGENGEKAFLNGLVKKGRTNRVETTS